jgi:hypothetical protein
MSFRLFIWYCTLAGAASALAGWALGRAFAHGDSLVIQGYKGLYLGLALGLALALVDALWNFALRRVFAIAGRAITATLVGSLAGLLGGLLGQALYEVKSWDAFLVVGYTLVGFLIGLAIGAFDLLACLVTNRDPRGALRKIKSGLVGGMLGGILGGTVSLLLRSSWGNLFADRPSDLLWSPSAAAFAALGACIGLMIGLAQVILKEAWVRVEQGMRLGRELILARDLITIGRAEGCDLGLFGDRDVEKVHAHIYRQGNSFVLDDAGTPGGTWVNNERLAAPHVLCSGDVIRVGHYQLRFGERARKAR